jgi:hypothetical protein
MHPEEDIAANDQQGLCGDHESMIHRLLFNYFALFNAISTFCLGKMTPLMASARTWASSTFLKRFLSTVSGLSLVRLSRVQDVSI